MNIHVLFEHSADLRPHGSAYIRLLLPLQHAANAGAWQLTQGVDYPGGAQVVIVDRLWRPGPGLLAAAEVLVERVRGEGACLIYSLDDNLLEWTARTLVQSGPTAEQLSTLRFLARQADGLLVSTPFLRDRLLHLNPWIQVVPNALDEGLLEPLAQPVPDGSRRLVIGLMGTYSHDADLRMILEPLRAALRAHSDQVELQWIGAVADSRLLQAFDGLPVRVINTGRPVEYPAFMRWFTGQIHWDIGLAPLEDTVFNRGKSDIKFLDYAALGAAGIFSHGVAYDRTVRSGHNGLLVENTVSAWRAALEQLILDGALRARLAGQARHDLLSGRVLSVCAPAWRQAIMAIVDGL